MIKVGKVDMLPVTSIEVGDRARVEFGDMEDLENSMKESGLIQPLAVKEIENNKFLLLAGGRRFTILLKNGVEEVPCRIYPDDITDMEIKVIEKAENFYRKDMEYWEYDNLIAEIHKLQEGIKGKAYRGGAAGTGHSQKDTAEMFGVTPMTVSKAIKRAEAREAFPELFETCKTQKDASKVLDRIDEAITKDAIARKIELGSKGSQTTLTKLADSYILSDFFEGVKKIPDGVIHLVEIDPPYAIELQDAKKADGQSMYNKDDYNEVDSNSYKSFLSRVFTECYRVMADHSWLICWFAPEPWAETVYEEITNAGFTTTRMYGMWPKGYGQSKRPEMRLANSYELFYYAWKGQPALNKSGSTNEFRHSPVPSQSKTHPTERPVELMKDIYETFAFPGSRVLIPFLGSGNGIIAAHQVGMSAVGFELSKSYRDSFLVKVNSIS